MYHVYLSLGSNLGNRQQHLAGAVEALRSIVAVEAVSSVYETEPVAMLDDAEPFLNMAVSVQTTDDPPLLLVQLKKIEKKMGRRDSSHRISRPIDIDILLYRGLAYEDHTVTVPHPSLAVRRFALEPLNEIAPMAVHPVLEKTIASLLRNCRDRHRVAKVDAVLTQIPTQYP
jgi:2-amino-4-hydroxy-6-hydroxymethyldihydropteridine diphosphokinase